MVLKCMYLIVGVGIVQMKIFVKLVNYVVKKWQCQIDGVVDLLNIDCQCWLLVLIFVEDVWGVGRCISKKLNVLGIKIVFDFFE